MNTRLIIEQYKNKNNLVQKIQETKQVQVIGESMMPTLDPTEVSALFVTNSSEYKVGDIVVFKYERSLVGVSVHRIIGKRGDVIITKGDNNLKSDGAINMSNIIGKIEKALMKDSDIIALKSSKVIAVLSKLEDNMARRLSVSAALRVHRVLIKLYRISVREKRR